MLSQRLLLAVVLLTNAHSGVCRSLRLRSKSNRQPVDASALASAWSGAVPGSVMMASAASSRNEADQHPLDQILNVAIEPENPRKRRVREEALDNSSGTWSDHRPTCYRACHECFSSHYQGCLAQCKVGCEDYCEERLPWPQCQQKQAWIAEIGHVFEALDPRRRMCQSTGLNGCPEATLPPAAPQEPMPYEYAYSAHNPGFSAHYPDYA